MQPTFKLRSRLKLVQTGRENQFAKQAEVAQIGKKNNFPKVSPPIAFYLSKKELSL